MKKYLINLPRTVKRLLMVMTDFVLLSVMAWLALALRGDGFFDINEGYSISGASSEQLYQFIIIAPIVTIAVLLKMRLYRSIIRYISLETYVKISKACFISVIILASIIMLSGIPIPRFIYPIYFILSTTIIIYSRYTASSYLVVKDTLKRRNVLIIGSDEQSRKFAELIKNDRILKPVGFLVESKKHNNSSIAELPIYNISDIDKIIYKKSIDEILMVENKSTKKESLSTIKKITRHQKMIRKVPNISDFASGKIQVSDFKRIDIEDLLGRVAIKTDPYLLKSCIKDKNVLVTGAGGSIGSELARQILQHAPNKIILLEQSEYFLYKIDNEINNSNSIKKSHVIVKSYLGSVSDNDFITNIFSNESIDTVYHAAANKHVPLVEHNPISAIKTNVLGTYIVAESALKSNIENFVLVSSDKAVRPTNIMGATKRFAELILQSFQDLANKKTSEKCRTKFCMVRFGNVLDTSGSVVPLFREQIMSGGPVTVTDSRVIRYFMTIQEATELVIQAGSLSKGGEVFLLDMGEPISILNLAKQMILLSGNEIRDDDNPNGDIEIKFIGLRAGEKLYEELLIGDDVSKTIHEHIMSANEDKLSHSDIQKYMSHFLKLDSATKITEVQNLLYQAIDGYKPESNKVVDINSKN